MQGRDTNNDFVRMIIDFNQRVVRIPQRDKKTQEANEAALGFKCLCEEAQEYLDSHNTGDYIGCVDAILDSIYFSVGILHKLGLTADEIHGSMKIVHESNMMKKFGTNAKRDTGAADAVKPEGWIPPEISLTKYLFGD